MEWGQGSGAHRLRPWFPEPAWRTILTPLHSAISRRCNFMYQLRLDGDLETTVASAHGDFDVPMSATVCQHALAADAALDNKIRSRP